MDVRLLDSEELRHEFQIRNLDPLLPGSLAHLMERIRKEELGEIPKPVGTIGQYNQEIGEVRSRAEGIVAVMNDNLVGTNPEMQRAHRARLLHLLQRIRRLKETNPRISESCNTVERTIQAGLDRIVENPVEEATGGIDHGAVGMTLHSSTPMGSQDNLNLPDLGLTIPLTNLTLNTGAIPRTTRGNRTIYFNPGTNAKTLPVTSAPTTTASDIPALVNTGHPITRPTQQYQSFGNNYPQYRQPAQEQYNTTVGNVRPLSYDRNYRAPPSNFSRPQRRNRFRESSPLKRWSLKFDGTKTGLSVEEFIYRLESLAAADGVQDDTLAAHAHEFLTGKASDWYWLYHRTVDRISWRGMREALLGEFRCQETDEDIRQVMHTRTQRPNETFADFRLHMQGLSSRLRNPMGPPELINIIRRNMSPKLRNALLLHEVHSLDHLRDLAQKFERLWMETEPRVKYRNISAMESSEEHHYQSIYDKDLPSNTESYTLTPQKPYVRNYPTEVIDSSSYPSGEIYAIDQPPDRDRCICWNCDERGHSFRECTVLQRNYFCYKCGTKGVVTPLCARCNPGNGRSSGANSGTPRLNHIQPEKRTFQSPSPQH